MNSFLVTLPPTSTALPAADLTILRQRTPGTPPRIASPAPTNPALLSQKGDQK